MSEIGHGRAPGGVAAPLRDGRAPDQLAERAFPTSDPTSPMICR